MELVWGIVVSRRENGILWFVQEHNYSLIPILLVFGQILYGMMYPFG